MGGAPKKIPFPLKNYRFVFYEGQMPFVFGVFCACAAVV